MKWISNELRVGPSTPKKKTIFTHMNRTCKWLYKYILYSPEYDDREGGGKQNTKKSAK